MHILLVVQYLVKNTEKQGVNVEYAVVAEMCFVMTALESNRGANHPFYLKERVTRNCWGLIFHISWGISLVH